MTGKGKSLETLIEEASRARSLCCCAVRRPGGRCPRRVRRRVIDISITEDDLAQLERIARSRTEPAGWVERARILLAYRVDPSAHAVGEAFGVTHQTVLRCLRRAVRFGVMAALEDSPRPGKTPEITVDARAWLTSLACRKAKDLGYPHELWTTRLLARHVREHAVAAGHPCLASVVQGTVCKILARDDVKPHKVRYYLERRDPAFETKMAEVLCVYREVAVLRAAEAGAGDRAREEGTSRSSPMTRSRASRRSTTPHPTCRRSPEFMRPSRATMNTNVMAH